MKYEKVPDYRDYDDQKHQLILDLKQRLDALAEERLEWEDMWIQISESMMPTNGRFLRSCQGTRIGARDVPQFNTLNNKVAYDSIRKSASGLYAKGTSPSRRWFGLTTGFDYEVSDESKKWQRRQADRMMAQFARNGIYSAIHEANIDLLAFGSACIILHDLGKKGVHFEKLDIGEFYWDIDKFGQVDTVARKVQMTVRQIEDRFGYDNMSNKAKRLFDDKKYQEPIDVVQFFCPRKDYIAGSDLVTKKRIAEYWFEEGECSNFLLETGYDFLPILNVRASVRPGAVYGYSAGMYTLGDVKALEHAINVRGSMLDNMCNPPLAIPSEVGNQDVRFDPGELIIEPMSGNGVRPLFSPYQGLQPIQLLIEDTKKEIQSGFYADIFMMIQLADKDNMKATEVIERREEKLSMIGPTIEYIVAEFIKPMVEKCFAMMSKSGILEPTPEDSLEAPFEVQFLSPLLAAQKSSDVQTINGFIQNVASFGTQEAFDLISVDGTVNALADLHNVPREVLRPQDEVEALRQQRAQLAQQQMGMAMAQQGAMVAESLSKTQGLGAGGGLDSLAAAQQLIGG